MFLVSFVAYLNVSGSFRPATNFCKKTSAMQYSILCLGSVSPTKKEYGGRGRWGERRVCNERGCKNEEREENVEGV